ncbi:MAG: bacteriocin immunity protein [Streptococcaceae bacterium]|nr:bacteriocin immunity protein [Streptococcaceae bacterium]
MEDIYVLVQNPTLSDKEREIFIKAKNLMETGEYVPNVIKRLYYTLALPAVKSELGKESLDFFNSLSKRFYKIAPLGSNIASLQVDPL